MCDYCFKTCGAVARTAVAVKNGLAAAVDEAPSEWRLSRLFLHPVVGVLCVPMWRQEGRQFMFHVPLLGREDVDRNEIGMEYTRLDYGGTVWGKTPLKRQVRFVRRVVGEMCRKQSILPQENLLK